MEESVDNTASKDIGSPMDNNLSFSNSSTVPVLNLLNLVLGTVTSTYCYFQVLQSDSTTLRPARS